MKKTILGAIAGLLMGAGLVLGQAPEVPMAPALAPPGMQAPPAAPWDGMPTSPNPYASEPNGFGAACACLSEMGFVDINLEYLLWWLQSPNFVGPAVTTGIIGQPLTNTLFGNIRIPYSREPLSGGRISVGYFLYDPHYDAYLGRSAWGGVELNYFDMGRRSLTFQNDTQPLLFRPFFDLNNRQPNALLIGAPGISTGGLTIQNTFDFWGAEANAWRNVFYKYPQAITRVDLMAGFRYFDLSEDFIFNSISVYDLVQPPGSPFGFLAGSTQQVRDLFATRNQFYGAQVGSNFKFLFGNFDFNVGTKVALGANNAQIRIEGNQVLTTPAGRTVSQGGLLALPTNIGRHHKSLIAWMPEINTQIAAHLTDYLTFRVGFTFLYLSRAYRPGVQIDRVIDITKIPNFPDGGVPPSGLPRPLVPFRETEVWAMGANFSVGLSW